ncbi:MAG: putative metabolite transport protein CsbC [Chlamydiales bacterium]|nr:putative metabolite transport protein CsbC [Chlamydiales bacterium]
MKSYVIASIAALGGFLFGYNVAVLSGAILFINHQFHLTDGQTEVVVASFLFGAIVGALLAGKGVSHFGRKKIIILTALLFALGALLTAFAATIHMIIWGRIIVGLGIGGASMAVPLYIAEMSPPNKRGFFVSFNQMMITAGICIAYLVNLSFAHHELWRYMLGIAVIPSVMLGIGMLFLPETPRWLLQKGEAKKAENVLLFLHPEELARFEFNEMQQTLHVQEKKAPLFVKKLSIPLLIGIALALFQQVTGINTIIYYAPTIFKMTGLESNVTAILATAGIGIVNFVMTLVAIQLIDRLGRRLLLLIGVAGMILSLGVLGLSFYFASPSALLGWTTTLCLIFYVASFAISLGPIFWLLIAEIYPLSVRGKAMSVATFINWSANLLVAITFLTLIKTLGQANTFWLYGLISIGCWLFIYFVVPETKGKTLEEIEQFWNPKSR